MYVVGVSGMFDVDFFFSCVLIRRQTIIVFDRSEDFDVDDYNRIANKKLTEANQTSHITTLL